MRYVLAALLLPAVCLLPALAQDNDGEKLYREIEKKIKSATAIQVASELRMEGGPGGMMETFTASLVLTKDNKARLKLSGSAGGKEVNMEIASDGKPHRPGQRLFLRQQGRRRNGDRRRETAPHHGVQTGARGEKAADQADAA